jgi:predicted nucleic acid-binding protein
MTQLFVDTSAWYALIDAKSHTHIQIKNLLKHYEHSLITSNFVIDETITLLRYRANFQAAQKFGEYCFSGQLAVISAITPQDEQAAWQLFKNYQDKKFSFTDCTSFILMQRLKISLAATLDNDFKTFGFQCLP